MDTKYIGTIIAGVISTSIALIGARSLYETVVKKEEDKRKNLYDTKSNEIEKIKNEIAINDRMIAKLQKECYDLTSYITENTLNFDDLKKFDSQKYSDRLTIANEAWRQCMVKRKMLITKLEVLTSK